MIPFGRTRVALVLSVLSALCILIVASASASSNALTVERFDAASSEAQRPLHDYLYYQLDKQQSDGSVPQTLDDLKQASSAPWQLNGTKALNFGFESGTLWLRVQLFNSSDRPIERIVSIDHPILDHIEYYRVQDGAIVEHVGTGDHSPLSTRLINSRFFSFPMWLGPGDETTLYFRIRSQSSMQTPVTISAPKHFYEHAQADILKHALYFGVMLAMLLYNFFLFLSLRESVYLFYILFVLGTLFTQMSITGLWAQFFFPELAAIQDHIFRFSVPTMVISAGLFTVTFLRLDIHAPKLYQWFMGLAAATACIFLIALFGEYKTVILASVVVLFATFLSCMLTGPYMWLKGSTLARYYTIAWVGVLLAILFFTLAVFDVIPRSAWTENSPPLFSALEAILLSFALADRLTQERRQRSESQLALLAETEQRRAAEAGLLRQALYHHRLQIPNRAYLESWYQQQESIEARFAICLIHFSRFHEVNKTLGHTEADQVLQLLCQRLEAQAAALPGIVSLSTEEKQFICSIEGASFALGLRLPAIPVNSEDPTLGPALTTAMDKFVLELSEPCASGELVIEVGALTGIALLPDHGLEIEPLLQKAQIAVDACSRLNTLYSLYSEQINPYSERRLSLAGDLRKAIKENSLSLAFQPKITAHALSIDSVEALLRWQHPQHGFIGPDEFIPVAEQTGIIHALTEWVLDEALRSIATLRKQGFHITVAINISAVNLRDRDFASKVKRSLNR
ncbi:hypothetical protein GCM10022278_33790 [Allohahella marinimesophila]|uniref:EAL domain-containing protein n=1 Tax=Allohahella marinimesophila TaxID=1054972 RepID=A0ABP7PZJ0_9GAMM